MNLCLIANGVETLEQMQYLTENKCHNIKWNLFSKPLQKGAAMLIMRRDKNEN